MDSGASTAQYEVADIMRGIYGDGIIACRAAFSRELVQELRADIDMLFEEAMAREGGALNRGPNRYYVEVHPERLRSFVTIAGHPWDCGALGLPRVSLNHRATIGWNRESGERAMAKCLSPRRKKQGYTVPLRKRSPAG